MGSYATTTNSPSTVKFSRLFQALIEDTLKAELDLGNMTVLSGTHGGNYIAMLLVTDSLKTEQVDALHAAFNGLGECKLSLRQPAGLTYTYEHEQIKAIEDVLSSRYPEALKAATSVSQASQEKPLEISGLKIPALA